MVLTPLSAMDGQGPGAWLEESIVNGCLGRYELQEQRALTLSDV